MSDSENHELAMTLEEKTARPVKSADSIARQTFGQLRKRYGSPKLDGAPPDQIIIVGMSREVWHRATLAGGAAKDSTVYELQGATP